MNKAPFDAIIILGGGQNIDGSLTNLSKRRLDTATENFQLGLANKIVVLGGRYMTYEKTRGSHSEDRGTLAKNYLINELNVSAENIEIVKDECQDTIYEAFASRHLAREKGWKRILVNTSKNHLRRALMIFQRIYGNDIIVETINNPTDDDLNPEYEEKLYEKTERLFSIYPPGKIPDPAGWDIWYKEHKDFYEEQIRTRPESEAYATTDFAAEKK